MVWSGGMFNCHLSQLELVLIFQGLMPSYPIVIIVFIIIIIIGIIIING